MYRLKLVFLFLTISLGVIACSGDSQQNVDDGAAATIDAQNTRIAELSGENSESAALQPTESSQLSTATVIPDPTSTALPTATPEPVAGVVWQKEGFNRIFPVPAIGLAFAYIHDGEDIQAISLETGDVLWTIQGKGMLLGADREFVYTVPFDQRVDAFEVNTGELRWFSTLPGTVESFTRLAGFLKFPSNQNFILIPGERNQSFAISKATGQVYAIEGDESDVEGEMIIVENGRGYFDPKAPAWDIGDRDFLPRCGGIIFNNIDTDTGLVQAMDVNTGDEIWTAQLPGYVRYAYCPGNGTDESSPQQVFLITYEWPLSRFVSVEALTGEVQYVNEGITYSYTKTHQWLDEGNNIVWGGEVNGLNIFSQLEFGITNAKDALDNSVLWESPEYSLFSVIGEHENIILGVQAVGIQEDRVLLGIDALSGELKWEFRPEDQRLGLADVGLVDDTVVSVYFRTAVRRIYFLDNQTGNVLFSDSDVLSFEEFGDSQIVAWGSEKIAVYRFP